jgi:hypothetical protein
MLAMKVGRGTKVSEMVAPNSISIHCGNPECGMVTFGMQWPANEDANFECMHCGFKAVAPRALLMKMHVKQNAVPLWMAQEEA